jgi:hypothetical protein
MIFLFQNQTIKMGTTTTLLFFVILITGLIAFFYKTYLQIIIKDPSKKGSFSSIVLRFVYPTDFLPMSVKYKNGEELKLRKKANKALTVFYISIISILILAAIA